MKKLTFILTMIILAGVILPLFAAAADEQDNYLGVGAYFREQPYTDDETSVTPVPIIYVHKDNWFVDGYKAGYKFWKYEDVSASAILQPRLMGYDDEDATILNGMDDRKMSLDGGIEVKWLLQNLSDIELVSTFVADVLSENRGCEAKGAIQKEFKGNIFVLKPSIGAKWESQNLVDYYYGVRVEEAIAGRPAYTPKQDYNFFGNIDFYLGLPKDFVLVATFGYEWLGHQIEKSPITDKSGVMSGVVGIMRKF